MKNFGNLEDLNKRFYEDPSCKFRKNLVFDNFIKLKIHLLKLCVGDYFIINLLNFSSLYLRYSKDQIIL